MDDDELIITRSVNNSFAKLIEGMWCHPIFNIKATKAYPIGDVSSNLPASDSTFLNMDFEEMKDFYYRHSGNSTIKIAEVREWGNANRQLATAMRNQMVTNPTIHPLIEGSSQISWMYRGLEQVTKQQADN